jgi:hypothetical protein
LHPGFSAAKAISTDSTQPGRCQCRIFRESQFGDPILAVLMPFEPEMS